MMEIVALAFFISVILIILTMILRGNMQAEEKERRKKQEDWYRQYEKEIYEKDSNHRINYKQPIQKLQKKVKTLKMLEK